MQLTDFCDRLDEELRTADYADVDASVNGLQVGPSECEIDRAAFAVDAAVETIERAAEFDADVLVVHHGLVWGGLDRVTGREYDRIAPLIENDMALYVSHLPLDGHQELGNAAGVADLLDLRDWEPFASLGNEHIGQHGLTPESLNPDELGELLATELEHDGRNVRALAFGPEAIDHVAIVTGSGVDWLGEAADIGADALITGEGKQKVYHEAKEAGINVFLAGHYATETFGVRSLQDLADEWGLDTTYIDVPTGL